jgi:hypothetical protein
LLYDRGRSLIQGFINGIASMIGAVKDKVKSVVSAVTNFLPGSPAKEGPLSGKGYVKLRAQRFMQDFADGVTKQKKRPSEAVHGAVRDMTPVIQHFATRGFATKDQTTSSDDGTREYVIQLGDKHFATLVVNAITGNPVAVKKAVDEGNRQQSWAGSGRK